MLYGAAYYPEHWPEECWAVDASRMRQAGLNLVRLGEFAWGKFEPEENKFDFTWIDRAIDILQKEGIAILIGTPTAGPPSWLVNSPTVEQDCRMVYENVGRWQFGGRSLCCVNHPRFIDRSRRIAIELGKHFSNHPNVVGFQIDNELGMYGTRCYCDHCNEAFRSWIRKKYNHIEELNQRLGLVFGSSWFRNFDEVQLPRLSQDMQNPSLVLDSQRFFSESNVKYVEIQAEALRNSGVRQPITTNICHMFGSPATIDNFKLFKNLDIVGWDCYPQQFAHDPPHPLLGFLHTIARSLKRKPYWMLEQQSGSPFGMAANDPLRIRLWTWQSVAHGARMILYFRWRTCLFGGEQYWRGILDHDNRPNERYRIVAQTGKELHKLKPLLQNLEYPADAAIFLDYESAESWSLNPCSQKFSYRSHAESYFSALIKLGLRVDVVFEPPSIDQYRILIIPGLRLINESWIPQLRKFVEAGGTLIATVCTASLTRDHVASLGKCTPLGLTDVFGVERFEWSNLSGVTSPPKERLGEDSSAWANLNEVGKIPVIVDSGPFAGTYEADTWCDHLRCVGAKVIGRFGRGSVASDCPAITLNNFGKGKAVYVATIVDHHLLDSLVNSLVQRPANTPVADTDSVEIVPCRLKGKVAYFILNHGSTNATVQLPAAMTDMVSDKMLDKSVTLAAYDVLFVG